MMVTALLALRLAHAPGVVLAFRIEHALVALAGFRLEHAPLAVAGFRLEHAPFAVAAFRLAHAPFAVAAFRLEHAPLALATIRLAHAPLAVAGFRLAHALGVLAAFRIEHALVVLALALGLLGGFLLARSRFGRRRGSQPDSLHHILLPFTGTEISRRAVDAAMRLARAEEATLMPAYLAQVPKSLPLECAIPKEAGQAMSMLEAIEQRARAQGVPVDARIERGRTYRHALARLLAGESFDRVVVSATATGTQGLSGDDIVWLLERAPTEVMILRPGPDDRRMLSANGAAPVAAPS